MGIAFFMVALLGLRVFPELPRAGTVRWPPMLWTGEGELQLLFFLAVVIVGLQVLVAVGFCYGCGPGFCVEVLLTPSLMSPLQLMFRRKCWCFARLRILIAGL